MRVLVFLIFCVAAALGDGFGSRIINGDYSDIREHPQMVALLFAEDQLNHRQACGGCIVNQRSVLTAAHCFDDGRHLTGMWRMRIGSTYANSGGTVLAVDQITTHPNYNRWNFDSDIAILRSTTTIEYGLGVQPARLASSNFQLGDNFVVWAVGWGMTEYGVFSERLLKVYNIRVISQDLCRQRYGSERITDNMLCTTWGHADGGQCQGDDGGPLYQNFLAHFVVGITSWSNGCDNTYYPIVNARVSRFSTWIQENA
ncbi:achelase-1-like [Anticarsia gemmatalis]|uniref:achelase-1-like n=1 Tax=Anticarsia gemmatalis TaxID=129554 RepID=UPI003F7691E9